MWNSSTAKVQVFLKRVAAFPSSYFVLLNVQELPSEHQELIFNFVSRPERGDTYNLHCIQLADTLLHASPWVETKVWGDEIVQKKNNDFKSHVQKWLHKNLMENGIFDRIVVVSSARCGTGKTRYILEELSRIQQDDPTAQTASISIHERTTVHSLVKSMLSKFSSPSGSKSVYFSFMIPVQAKHRALMNMLNYFFQSLFLLGSVQDPQNGVTFYLGSGRWNVFIELQANDSRDYDSSEKLLSQFIPILALCSSYESPPNQYHIDDKAHRVCTYLRAFDDRTIDRKFQPIASKKQLIFVIDKSGSMEQEMGNGRNALDTALDNAIKIFNSHVQVDDVS
jgi:hypothetical protein